MLCLNPWIQGRGAGSGTRLGRGRRSVGEGPPTRRSRPAYHGEPRRTEGRFL